MVSNKLQPLTRIRRLYLKSGDLMKQSRIKRLKSWLRWIVKIPGQVWSWLKRYNASVGEYHDYHGRLEDDHREKYFYYNRGIR